MFEEDVGFGDVAEDERYFCGVAGVFEYGARELVHSVMRLGLVGDWGFWGGKDGGVGDCTELFLFHQRLMRCDRAYLAPMGI